MRCIAGIAERLAPGTRAQAFIDVADADEEQTLISPANLKGWVDRVYACGFAYGVGEHSDKCRDDRYGEGALAARALFDQTESDEAM